VFLSDLGSDDRRFKRLRFHEGMNILLSDRTNVSTLQDSRNGAGKSSFVRIFRYLLGGDLDGKLKAPKLKRHSFYCILQFPDSGEMLMVERSVSSTTQIRVGNEVVSVKDWRQRIAKSLFALPETEKASRPTAPQLISQLARTNIFDVATKTHGVETDWESGARIGYFLGLSPEILSKAHEVAELEAQRKALNKITKSGVLSALNLKEPDLLAQLAQARYKYNQIKENLRRFRVDVQYNEHQAKADKLSARIRDLNDEALALEQRRRDIQLAIDEEVSSSSANDFAQRLSALYEEVGITLPKVVRKRFDEVEAFHASLVKNRKFFLESELHTINHRLITIKKDRDAMDASRASIMELLKESMALETFLSAEQELTWQGVTIADLEKKLEAVQSLANLQLHLKAKSAEAEVALRAEMSERKNLLNDALALFAQLGSEVYKDRQCFLRVEPTDKGVFKVEPKIDGDASTGISEVKTFLLDMVCAVMGIRLGRTPQILIHDSLLFDSMDNRQMASCLNVGSRLAREFGFQYIVTLNSDRLEAAEQEGFVRADYVIEPILTDRGETGGLFGFRFD
jgi:uncharacterized protein YydD (DUF2326 family)